MTFLVNLAISLVVLLEEDLEGGQRRSKGSDMRIRVKLTLEEIASGVEKKIKVPRKVQAPGVQYGNCSTCNGTGQVTKIANTILGRMQTSSICPNCSGSGKTILNRPSGSDPQGLIKKRKQYLSKYLQELKKECN